MRWKLLVTAALLAATIACAPPVVRNHGQVWEAYHEGDVVPGQDNRESVRSKLGSPSAREVAGDAVWIYVSSTTESVLGSRPKVVGRRVLALEFDSDGKLAFIREYGEEDGILVAINQRTTPTAGRQLNLIQQLLGNVGRFEGSGTN